MLCISKIPLFGFCQYTKYISNELFRKVIPRSLSLYTFRRAKIISTIKLPPPVIVKVIVKV